MKYKDLCEEDFDALITGELTHYAIWMENQLIGLISSFFRVSRYRTDFERLLLRRDGLTFQDKIEIVRAMLPLFKNQQAAQQLKVSLGRMEEFKAVRNAFAHGLAVDKVIATEATTGPCLRIEVVTRSGKERIVNVTPESHEAMISEAALLVKEVLSLRLELMASEAESLLCSSEASSHTEQNRADCLLVELEVALTFLEVARVSQVEDTILRNQKNARETYDKVLCFLPKLSSEVVQQTLETKLNMLKTRLQAVGYQL